MALRFSRIISRVSSSSLRSGCSKSPSSFAPSINKAPKTAFSKVSEQSVSPVRRFSLSRVPSELGAVQSMLPLHSAVAAARMTSCLSTSSRSCRALSQGTLCCTSPDL